MHPWTCTHTSSHCFIHIFLQLIFFPPSNSFFTFEQRKIRVQGCFLMHQMYLQPSFGALCSRQHWSRGRGWVPAGSSPLWQHPKQIWGAGWGSAHAGRILGAAAPLSIGHHGSPASLHRRPHRHLRVRPDGRGHHRLGFGGKVSVTSSGEMFPHLAPGEQNLKETRLFCFLWNDQNDTKLF